MCSSAWLNASLPCRNQDIRSRQVDQFAAFIARIGVALVLFTHPEESIFQAAFCQSKAGMDGRDDFRQLKGQEERMSCRLDIAVRLRKHPRCRVHIDAACVSQAQEHQNQAAQIVTVGGKLLQSLLTGGNCRGEISERNGVDRAKRDDLTLEYGNRWRG